MKSQNERKRTFLLISVPILLLFFCFNTVPLIRGFIYSYRLSNPESDNFCAWEYVYPDGSEALICAVILHNHGNMPAVYVTPRGLSHGAFYRDIQSGKIYPSDALMDSGFPLEMLKSDYDSFILRLERI